MSQILDFQSKNNKNWMDGKEKKAKHLLYESKI